MSEGADAAGRIKQGDEALTGFTESLSEAERQMDSFDDVAKQAWEKKKTPLERMYDVWVGEGVWEPDPPQPTFRIHDKVTGRPFLCHLCGVDDKWVAEGDEVKQIVKVFVCEHEPISIGHGAIRQVSSVPAQKVGYAEVTSRPRE